MTKQELEKKFATHRLELRKMRVVSLAVFCSIVRNESTQRSDRDVGLFKLFEIQHRLEEIIGVAKVDLIQKGAIHPALREQILSEAVNVA